MSTLFSNFSGFVGLIVGYISLLMPVVSGLALLAFFWGLAKFILNPGNEAAVKEGRNLMVWGTIALFIMVSIFGILRFMSGELGLGTFGLPLLPTN